MYHKATFQNFDKSTKIDTKERQCGDCTYCCEGWLSCNVFGYEIGWNKPCKFVVSGKGCSAYNFRPEDPCKTFKCLYRQDDRVPVKFKPKDVGNIMIARTIDGTPFLDIIEAGKPLSLEILDWALEQFRIGRYDSIRYFFNGKMNYVSRNEKFIELMKQKLKERDYF